MQFVFTETGEVIEKNELVEHFPNTAVDWNSVLTDEFLTSLGLVQVQVIAQPPVAINQVAIRDGVTQDANGNWLEVWKITNKTADVLTNDLTAAKDKMWEAIKVERDRRANGGVLVSNKWFHTDDASRIKYIGLTMMGSNMPANLQWKTLDGTFATMTPELATAIFSAVSTLDMTAFANAERHRVAMEASNDPANYKFNDGWPTIYDSSEG